MHGKFLLIAPVVLLMIQAGMILSATHYYYAIRKVAQDKRPAALMGVSYLSTTLVLVVDISSHITHDTIVVWQLVVYTLISVLGAVSSFIVIRYEITELRELERKDITGLRLRQKAFRTKARVYVTTHSAVK